MPLMRLCLRTAMFASPSASRSAQWRFTATATSNRCLRKQWPVASGQLFVQPSSVRSVMFIVNDTRDEASSVRSVMSTLRPDGASSCASSLTINRLSLRDSLATGHCPLTTDHCSNTDARGQVAQALVLPQRVKDRADVQISEKAIAFRKGAFE